MISTFCDVASRLTESQMHMSALIGPSVIPTMSGFDTHGWIGFGPQGSFGVRVLARDERPFSQELMVSALEALDHGRIGEVEIVLDPSRTLPTWRVPVGDAFVYRPERHLNEHSAGYSFNHWRRVVDIATRRNPGAFPTPPPRKTFEALLAYLRTCTLDYNNAAAFELGLPAAEWIAFGAPRRRQVADLRWGWLDFQIEGMFPESLDEHRDHLVRFLESVRENDIEVGEPREVLPQYHCWAWCARIGRYSLRGRAMPRVYAEWHTQHARYLLGELQALARA